MLGKVDAGGGGTIARGMSDDEMDVIDVGIPELSMHSPYSLVARADVEEAVKAFSAFYK
jgi:aspartyl aminopeptidase